MPHLGFWELIIILAIVLLVFGAGKLPQIGDGLGRAIKNFKRAASGTNELDVSKKSELETTAKAEDAEVVEKKR
jgi:sec-independent protein translocase protein TatA